jgi:hypothetical protein
MSFVVSILVTAVDVIRILALGAGVDRIAPAGISSCVGMFAAEAGFGVDWSIAQGLARHGLATAVAASPMRLALVPTVLQLALRQRDQSRTFADWALCVTLGDRVPA